MVPYLNNELMGNGGDEFPTWGRRLKEHYSRPVPSQTWDQIRAEHEGCDISERDDLLIVTVDDGKESMRPVIYRYNRDGRIVWQRIRRLPHSHVEIAYDEGGYITTETVVHCNFTGYEIRWEYEEGVGGAKEAMRAIRTYFQVIGGEREFEERSTIDQL